MLVEGVWQEKWQPVQKQDEKGRFLRQSSSFRERISPEQVQTTNASEPRFTLYVAYICPWATRTLIARSLLGLEKYIDVKSVDPVLTDYGWKLDSGPWSYMHELYTQSDQQYTGRATVPVIWDNQEQRIINNESADILEIFNKDLHSLKQHDVDLHPVALTDAIFDFNNRIYNNLNNGVYRAGFATSQEAYQEAYTDVFATLDWLEEHFSGKQYAVGEQLTESDIRLFVTLVRFDLAYYGLFKTNKKRITDYANLSAYLDRLLAMPAFSQNTRIDHIKQGYYSIKQLNPNGIVPEGPELEWFKWLGEK